MSESPKKTCLVVSYGPVPTPQYQTVEGGGMRAWGLAMGLQAHGIDVTVAVNIGFPQEIQTHQGVKLTNWSLDEHFKDLINSFDAVIISYCMGDPSVFVADNISPEVQLILDVYVPIYVEVSARDSKDIETEYRSYAEDIKRFNHVLRRGDYFLCASETQKIFYTGVLGALGIVNPRSYRQDRIIIAPFGIHDEPAKPSRNPYKELGVNENDFLVLWFGGLYPWFQVDEFLAAVKELSKDPKIKFAIVGGKNPFNPNPDFSKQYDHAVNFAKKQHLYNKSLIFVDWVDFDDRINWYGRANLVISINKPGDENTFAWRTRVMDYVWGELPILTNGSDPLSEQLLAEDAAIRLESLSQQSMSAAIKKLVDTPQTLGNVKKALLKIKDRYFWPHIMEPLAKIIETGDKPSPEEAKFRRKLKLAEPSSVDQAPTAPVQNKISRALGLSRRAVSYARRKGLRRSARLALTIAKTQAKTKLTSRERHFVFISHPINHTGAPLVMVEMVQEFAKAYGPGKVRLISPHTEPDILRRLRTQGVKVEKAAAGLGSKLLSLQLGIQDNDFVLINTVAVYHNYLDYVFGALRAGKLKHAFWFIHEDIDQLPGVNQELLQKRLRERVSKLVGQGKLTLLVPSVRTKKQYDEFFGTNGVEVIHERIDIPTKYKKGRDPSEYSRINFMLSGTPSDGRKGQLIAISAFYDFIKNYQQKAPKNYRDFKLHLVGIGEDYISKQIKWIGSSLLGHQIVFYPSLPFSDALAVTAKCNAVICCSLNETFSINVAEAMFAGNVVLRNNSAGVDEQLKEGVNGFAINHQDVHQFAAVIEKVLNKNMLTNAQLQKMGIASQAIISKYQEHNYLEQIVQLDQKTK